MLTICTWLWGNKYTPHDVAKLAAGVRRNLQQAYRFVCITDRVEYFSAGVWSENIAGSVASIRIPDDDLLSVKGCFARLRLFDPSFQKAIEREIDDPVERIVNMDLDSVVTGPLDPLFNRPETFMILQGANAANPCPFNGSLMMLRAGAHPEVWSDFSLDAVKTIPFFEFPDDQGWLHHKLPKASGWKVGSPSGVYAFAKPGWPVVQVEDVCSGRKSNAPGDLPKDAALVVFPGWRSPEKFKHLKWVQENWR